MGTATLDVMASWSDLALGALTGLVFGFLLQKGRVTRADVILNQFLFRDFTVLKVMLTAIVVGAVGVWGMLQAGMIEHLHVKNAALYGNAVGGLIFGVGMAVLGYCPGTGVAALGDGSRHAIPGVLGMVFGAAVYAEAHPWLNAHLNALFDMGKATMPSATGLSPWWFIAGLLALSIGVFVALERRERRPPAPGAPGAPGAPRVA